MRPVAAAGPVARVRLAVPSPQVAGSAERRSVHRVGPVHPVLRERPVRPEHQVAAENCSDVDRLVLRLRAVPQPEASVVWLMEPLLEEAVAVTEAGGPAAMAQLRPEALQEVAASSWVAPPAGAVGEEVEVAVAMVDARSEVAAAEGPAVQPGVAAAEEVVVAQGAQPEAAVVEVEVLAAQPEGAVEAVAPDVQLEEAGAVVPQQVEAVRPADARREAARPSAAASRPSSVRAGPDPAGPGQRPTCHGRPPRRPARWIARATASSKSPSLPARQDQFASSKASRCSSQ